MLTRLLAATIVAALGAGAGFYYAFSDSMGSSGCSASRESSLATSEGSCCVSMRAVKAAKMSCCAEEGAVAAGDSCPFSGEQASAADALAACTGGMTAGLVATKVEVTDEAK